MFEETKKVRSFQYAGRAGLILLLVAAFSLAGCTRKVKQQTGPTVTTPSVGGEDEPDEPVVDNDEPDQPVVDNDEPDQPVVDTGEPDKPVVDTGEPDKPAPAAGLGNLVPIALELPAPAFRGTPKPGTEPNVEPPRGKPRDPFLAPEGTVNLALGKIATCSDPAPSAGEVDYITDGDKEASDFGYLELRPGTEWVQVDLGERATIYAVVIWHNHAEARVYRDVIVQISDDPYFIDAQTVFNNDYDNSSGMGIGDDMGYVETSEGKLIDCKGSEGRYVRFYSRGNHFDPKNHYIEVEVYGQPAP